jgi:hypothetical protein
MSGNFATENSFGSTRSALTRTNIEEKAKLVQDMYKVYRSARNVTRWLGPSDNMSQAAVQTVRDFIAKYSGVTTVKDGLYATELLDCHP